MTGSRRLWNVIAIALMLASVAFAGVRYRHWYVVEHPQPVQPTPSVQPVPPPAPTAQAACKQYWDNAGQRCLPLTDYLRETCPAKGGHWDGYCRMPAEERREACLARGGLNDGAQGCIEPSQQAECAVNEGRWEGQPPGHPPLKCIGKPQRIACEGRGGRWYVGGIASVCYEAARITACTARGGTMQQVGMGGMLDCIVVAGDRGKQCNDGSQCSTGRCLYQGDTLVLKQRSGLTGQCASDNNAFGCFVELTRGKISRAYCAD